MEFRILGPLEVAGGDGPVRLRGQAQRHVLAALLLSADRLVPVDHLVDAVWEDPPTTARTQVQNTVSALRRILTGTRTDAAIATEGVGYVLRLRSAELDARRFDSDVAAARELAAAGRAGAAAQRFRQALGRWRGPALFGLDTVALQVAAAGLDETRITVTEELIDLDLAAARHTELVPELTRLIAAHPTRERLVGQLMLALYRSGRASDALEVYRDTRARLADELGIDPGADLRELELAILRRERRLDPPARPVTADTSPGASAGTSTGSPAVALRPAQLPGAVADFVGRGSHLRRLQDLLSGHPSGVVITAIAGTAGVGKTALAVHFAHRVADQFTDGQLYVNLRGYSPEPTLTSVRALALLLQGLGVPGHQIPTELDAAAGMYRSMLARRRFLVLLDNAASAEQVRPLLPGSPGCLAVVTSRDQLTGLVAFDGAHPVLLDVLSPEEARSLLLRVSGPRSGHDDAQEFDELAQLCGYLPLALRIAAAHLRNDPQQALHEYLAQLRAGNRVGALSTGGDDRATVRAALDLSYQRLDAAQRRTFRLLGLVPGPDFTCAAAAVLTGASPAETQRALDRLVGACLIQQHTPGRYQFHDLLRAYAAGLPEDTAPEATRRLYRWYLGTADAAASVLYPDVLRLPSAATGADVEFTDHAGALAWLDAERANLLAAATHPVPPELRPKVWLLADALRGYFILRHHSADWVTTARAGLGTAESAGDLPGQAAAHLSLGLAHHRSGDPALAHRHSTAAAESARRANWPAAEAAAFANLGSMCVELGQLAPAAEHSLAALIAFRRANWPAGEANTLINLGVIRHAQGQLVACAEQLLKALELLRDTGSRAAYARALGNLGEAYRDLGRLDRALPYVEQALALARESGDRDGEATTLDNMARVLRDSGDLDRALRYAHDALRLAGEVGIQYTRTAILNTVASVEELLGDPVLAGDHYIQALDLATETGDSHEQVVALLGLAGTHLAAGEPDPARRHTDRALELARRNGFRMLEGLALSTLAEVRHAGGAPAEALDHALHALTVHRETGHRPGQDRTLRALRRAHTESGGAGARRLPTL